LIHLTSSRLFQGIPEEIEVGRYHSLIVQTESVPPSLRVTAWSSEHEIMALEHNIFPVFGVQFHPESILTPFGKLILSNFLEIKYAES
jgi:anthranilate/para-aminobenzoate synthase component II